MSIELCGLSLKNSDRNCSQKLYDDAYSNASGGKVTPVAEQGELYLQEHRLPYGPIDPGAPTYFYPSDLGSRKLIPFRP